MFSERDGLDKVLSDAAKCLAVSEDSQHWAQRLTFFLQAFEDAAERRSKHTIRPADTTPLVQLALERLCHALVARLLYKRW
jgi:hypothetical protein